MNKKRIILSVVVGCIALATFSVTTSIAWYISSDSLSIDTLNIVVSSDREIKVSTSPELDSFVNDLKDEDLKNTSDDFHFSPVSTIFKDVWMEEKPEMPIFYDCSYPGAFSSGEPYLNESQKGFFRQKLYLLSDGDYLVGLDAEQCVFENNAEANLARAREVLREYPNADMTENEIKERLDNLLKCLRVSILVPDEEHYQYLILDPTKGDDEEVVFGGRLDNDTDGYYDVYSDQNSITKEIIYGQVNDRSLIKYDEPTNNLVEPLEKPFFFGNSFTAKSKGSVHTYNAEKSLQNGLQFAKEESTTLEQLNVENPSFFIPCYRNQPREIVLSIYLEGWDLNCINETMGASFNTKLSFKLLRGNI